MAERFEGSGEDSLNQAVFELHPSDDDLELYSMGRTTESESNRIEEHVLVCSYCQDRLEESDEFVALMKDTTKEIANNQEEGLAKNGQRRGFLAGIRKLGGPAITSMAAILALMVGLSVYNRGQVGATPGGEAAIQLVANRGADPAPVIASTASAIRLSMDTAGLPAGTLEISLVAEDGSAIWSGSAASAKDRAQAVIPQSLKAGRYFVRVSSNSVLLREFAFRVS